MKWKVTTQFLVYMILTIVLSLFAFLALNILFLYFGRSDSLIPYQSPSNYTLNFEKNIDVKKEEISIPTQTLNELKQGHMWIQVLDENGTEIYSRFKPAKVPVHYTPAKLIHYHKYTGALEHSTIFVGTLERGNRNLSYIIGFPEEKVGKYTDIYYQTETLIRDLFMVFSIVVIVMTLFALLFGFLFSHKLAKPLIKIIEGIQSLAKGEFRKIDQPKGIYKQVFQNLNELASTLQSNEIERSKMEKMREEWVTNITHDIKTPLASIKGYSELLQDKEYKLNDLERERYMEIILDHLTGRPAVMWVFGLAYIGVVAIIVGRCAWQIWSPEHADASGTKVIVIAMALVGLGAVVMTLLFFADLAGTRIPLLRRDHRERWLRRSGGAGMRDGWRGAAGDGGRGLNRDGVRRENLTPWPPLP